MWLKTDTCLKLFEFKKPHPGCKRCSSSAHSAGTIVVEGHELHTEDLRLMYTFDQVAGGSAQYEAHSDAQVFCWLSLFVSY